MGIKDTFMFRRFAKKAFNEIGKCRVLTCSLKISITSNTMLGVGTCAR